MLFRSLPIISNIAGQLVRDEVMSQAEYWTEHVLAPVRFAQSINLLQQQGYDLFLEIGPAERKGLPVKS